MLIARRPVVKSLSINMCNLKSLISLSSLLIIQSFAVNATSHDTPLKESSYELVLKKYSQSALLSHSGVSVNDINVSLSGWSDTGDSLDPESKDMIVKSANAYKVVDNNGYYYGYGVLNQDGEGSTSPNHSADNYFYNGKDNADGRKYADFDFILFSFDEKVTLDEVGFGWVNKHGDDQQVSIAGINDNQLSSLKSQNSTWTDIINGAVSNSFNITKKNGSYQSSGFGFTEGAKYWLVGAYNTVFGTVNGASMYNDGLKITSINFTKALNENTEVSEPGALALMSLGLGLVLYRRKRRV